jgi:hypothetical protein
VSGGVKGPKALTLIAVTLLVAQLALADDWKPVLGHLMTRWAKDVNPQAPLLGYPRPQLRRGNWKNLNGLWDYAVPALEAPPGRRGVARYQLARYSGMRFPEMAGFVSSVMLR